MPERKRILIINPFGIGDVLFCTPLIRNLRFYYPDAFIAVAVQKKVAPVLENNPYINKVIPFSRGDFKDLSRQSKAKALKLLFKTIAEILRERFNLYFDLSLEHRYSLLLKLFGIRPRIGYNYKNRGRFLTHKIDIQGYTDKHVVEYHLGLLNFLGIKPQFRNLELFLRLGQKDWAKNFLEHKSIKPGDLLVGIAPFGGESFGAQKESRRWPIENYARLADLLIDRLNAKIVILAGPKEKESLKHLFSIMHNKDKTIDAAETSITQLASIINNCQIVISNDAGPLHLTVASNIPSVSLFGPSDEKVYGPYPANPKHIVLSKDFDCRPCYKYFRLAECRYQRRCLTAITVHEVFREAERLLNILNYRMEVA